MRTPARRARAPHGRPCRRDREPVACVTDAIKRPEPAPASANGAGEPAAGRADAVPTAAPPSAQAGATASPPPLAGAPGARAQEPDGGGPEGRLGDTLQRFFREYLDETRFREYRVAERTVATLKAQGLTPSGVPRVRPSDCARALAGLREAFRAFEPQFRSHDPEPIERFERLMAEFVAFVDKTYPAEAVGVRLLHAEVHLLLNDPAGVEAAIGAYADRPYLLQGGLDDFRKILELRGRALLLSGKLDERGLGYLDHGRLLVRASRVRARHVAESFAPFLAAARRPPRAEGVIARRLVTLARALVRARRERRGLAVNAWLRLYRSAIVLQMAALFRLLAHVGELRWRTPADAAPADLRRRYLVTRAMGGIGDLLMMTPGLRALAKKSGAPVDLAVPRAFFPVFENNPHVRLLDINGAPIDTLAYRGWRNLSICPAGRYESRHRPHVRKGRVELFARGMGVGRGLLTRHGWTPQVELSGEQIAFRDRFLAESGFGRRRLVGVQPYSRDSYKDHPRIADLIRLLAQEHDVLVLHHLAAGIPEGPGIRSTAGLTLGQSFALVSALEAMVSVDSAFLHAAAAFDVPVVALFGPTDGRTFTRHHRRARVIWKPETFGCSPCWRNEDLPCLLTGTTGISPCVAALGIEDIRDEVNLLLGAAGASPAMPALQETDAR